MSRLLESIRYWLRNPHTREFLLWCLPALLIGLTLRVILTVHMPYGFFHDDTGDFLRTPEKLLGDSRWDLHPKKTFLVPAVFTIPFLIRIPALIILPLFQHFLGLLLIVFVGLLCRLWFRHWKVVLPPLTIITAINPYLLWYEHTLLAETMFVVCTVFVAVCGTIYALAPTRSRFILLCIALVLEAGARPEGKLIFGFGLFLLVLLHAREWREMWPRLAIMLAVALVTHTQTKTAQGGLLLYTSVVRLTPTDLKVAPGFDRYIAPLRADLQQRWDEKPQFPKVRDRRAVAIAVENYLKDNPHLVAVIDNRGINDFCLKLAIETCRRNFSKLPVHTYYKFREVSNEPASGLFDNEWIFIKQRSAFLGDSKRALRLSRGLTGSKMKEPAELSAFVDAKYGEVRWFNEWTAIWQRTVNYFRFPDWKYKDEWGIPQVYPGVPYYFLVAAIGVFAIMFRRGTLQPFHIAWGLTILAFFYVIMLTANVRPRFRFVFEPFWFIYIAALGESLWIGVTHLFVRK